MKKIIRRIIFWSAVFICLAITSHRPKQIDGTVILFPQPKTELSFVSKTVPTFWRTK